MALLTDPLYAAAASGSIGKQITYSNQWGSAIARGHRTTPLAPSSAQIANMQLIAAFISQWRDLDPSQKNAWAARAPAPLTGYNLFLSAMMTAQTIAAFPPVKSFYGLIPLGELEYGWDE